MKAVILAAGRGRRMRRPSSAAELTSEQRRVAASGVKALVPTGRPFLDYVLAGVVAAGVRRVCLVVGPAHDELRQRYGGFDGEPLAIELACQREPRGTADALLAAERFASGGPFLMLNSDNYYPPPALVALAELDGPGLIGFDGRALVADERSNITIERLAGFALLQTTDEGELAGLVEKPPLEAIVGSSGPLLVSLNCWRFSPAIFDACRRIEPSERGELEITAAVGNAMAAGERFRVVPSEAPVLDLSSRDDVAGVSALLAGVEVPF